MTQPLFFEPDPSIDDSDQLGYGNLIFDNGSTQWVNGDPEIAGSLPRAPERTGITTVDHPGSNPIPDMTGVQDPNTGELYQQPEPGLNPVSPLAKIGSAFADTMRGVPPPGQQGPLNPQPIPGTEYQVDLSGNISPAGAGQGQQAAAPQTGSAMPPQPIPGTPHAVDPATGNIIQGGATQEGYGSGGLQLAQREGALPQDVAAQQASARETQNTNQVLALQTSRDAEFNTYRQAALQRAGQLDAERQAQQKQLDEQQQKLARWQDEQKTTADLDIKTDLVSAEGGIGALFSILGAAALGAVGSDAGLRMIDNAIDTNVKKQINMRDSKLRVLSDRVGSTEQAISAGKAQLYRIAADKAEATERLTKADAFAAQTPSLVANLRSQQLANEQKEQQISLGKTLEKAPAGPAQPKPIDVEKYGKAAAEQRQGEQNIDRAANAIGLAGWDPKSGKFANREEILKNGIPGAGKLDAFLQGIPGLRNIDNAATSDAGLKVRAALEALVAAEAKQQNPGRAPTDADRDAARISLGLNTEQGIVAAVERLKGLQEQAKAQNTAAFGSAAGAYENRIDAMGARPPQQHGEVDMGTPLEPGKAREMLQQERMRPRTGLDAATQEATGQPGPQASVTPMQDVAGEVQAVAGRELPPEGIKILTAQAAHETGDGQHAPGNNFFGIKGKGNNLETTEGEGANARRVRSDFRAYGSPTESVQDLVSLLQRRYPEAWKALERGDAPAYVAALKDGGYFTGSETEYLNGIQRRL